MDRGELGVRILSLDAGGPGIYFQLLALKELMARMTFDLETSEEVLPSSYFDLVVASGFGSLVALCIGCLELSVEEAIEDVFRASRRIFPLESMTLPSEEQSSLRLRGAVQDILERRGVSLDVKLKDKLFASRRCKVAFLTTASVEVSISTILRTYPVRQFAINCTLVDAVCASMTIPGLFPQVLVGPSGLEHSFIGSSLFHNNPIREALREAERAFGRDRRVAAILSLGAGRIPTLPVGELVQGSSDPASLVSRMSLQSEIVARELESTMGSVAAYVRLNVDFGIHHSLLHDWKHLGSIEAQTVAYFSQEPVNRAIDASLDSLKSRVGLVTVGQLNISSPVVPTAKKPPRTTASFVLREKQWGLLTRTLQKTNPQQQVVVLTGLGGTGKTQFVSHYIESYHQSYRHIVFVDASSESNIRADLQGFARSLGPGHERDTADDALSYLTNVQSKEWLLCFDNADKPGISLIPFFPPCYFGTIMITSRNPTLGRLANACHLELGDLSEEESILLLEKSSGASLQPPSEARQQARALAEDLGHHALALSQAGSYCRRMSSSAANSVFSFSQYRLLLKRHRIELLKRSIGNELDDYRKGVYTTLELSFSQLSSRAKKLLHLMGFFHHANIPLGLFAKAAESQFRDAVPLVGRIEPEPELELLQSLFITHGSWSELSIHDLLQELNSFSLITLHFSLNTVMLSLHPLINSWAKDSLPQREVEEYRRAACRVISSFPARESTHIHQYLTAHIVQLTQADGCPKLEPNELLGFGSLLQAVGQFSMAYQLYNQAMQIVRATVGPEDSRITDISQYIATLALEAGRLQEAESMQLNILARREAVYTPDQAQIAEAKSQLASIYRMQGRWAESENLDAQVLEYRRKYLGDDHRDTLRTLENLARTCWELGRWQEAVSLEEDVLSRRKQLLGDDDIDTSRAESALASSYFQLGQRGNTLSQETEIWKRREKLLGSKHPDTLVSKASLASTYRDTGSWTTAATLLSEVLQTQKEVLGITHPEVYATMSSLSHTLWLQGKWQECERLESETLAWKERHLGKGHPDTITTAIDLACTYLDLGRWNVAVKVQEEALALRRTAGGEAHPLTLQAKSVLAATYRVTGRWNEAVVLIEEVLAVRRQTLGREHPDSIHAQGSLASVYFRQGRYEDAEGLELEVWDMCQRHFGPAAPATIHAMWNLAETWRELGRLREANDMQCDALALAVAGFGPDHPDTLLGHGNYAKTLACLGYINEALQIQEDILQRTRHILDHQHPNTYLAARDLAVTYRRAKRLEDSVNMLQENLRAWIAFIGKDHPATLEAVCELLESHRALGQLTERDQLYEEWMEKYDHVLGEAHPLSIKFRRCSPAPSGD